jgi:hypothetical protein
MPYLADAELAEIVPELWAPISPLQHKSNPSNPIYLHYRMEDMLKRPTVAVGAPLAG